MQVSKIEELTLNEIEQVNGGIAPLAFPLAYKAFVAGAAFGSGLVMAAYKMVEQEEEMTELNISEQKAVCGGVAPLVAVGYLVAGSAFGAALAAGAIWIAKQLQ